MTLYSTDLASDKLTSKQKYLYGLYYSNAKLTIRFFNFADSVCKIKICKNLIHYN